MQMMDDAAEALPVLLPREVYILEGDRDSSSAVMHAFCAEQITMMGRVVWVDGGNVLDPLLLSRMMRSRRCSTRYSLDRVTIARAFTAYQMSSIIEDRLPGKVREESPSLVMVTALSALFADPDVDGRESRELIRRSMGALVNLAAEGSTVLISGYDGPSCARRIRAHKTKRGLVVNTPGGV